MIALGTEASGAARRSFVGLLLASVVAVAACDKVPLTAPSGSTVTLVTNTTILAVNGTAEITATVLESGGTLVQNGTLVTFTTTLGSLDPAEARTNNGKASVRLHAGARSGVAIVRAFSGGAASSNEEGSQVAIAIGGAAAGRIALSASPSSVSAAGGTVALTAVVFDVSGNRLPGVPVSFSSTAGALSASVVTSDGNGEARTNLTTSRTARVTATAGGTVGGEAVTAEAEIAALALPVVGVTATPANPSAGQPVIFGITATAADGATIRTLTVDYGDGQVDTLPQTTSVAHVYRSAGTYTVRVTAEDTNGARGTGSATIVVAAEAPLLVSLAASPNSTTTGTIVTFTVTVTQNPNQVPVSGVTFDFGDGNGREVAGLSTTHVYGTAGNLLARAVVRFSNGQSAEGTAAVVVR